MADEQEVAPDHPLWSMVVTVELTVYEAHLARAAVKHQADKRRRGLAKSSFTPEPGKLNMAKVRLAALETAQTKFSHAVKQARKEAGCR